MYETVPRTGWEEDTGWRGLGGGIAGSVPFVTLFRLFCIV